MVDGARAYGGPSMIATGTALAIGALSSAGAGLASAKMQSSAAKNAAKEQQKGTDRALQIQREANAPYMQLGQQAAGRLQQPAPAYTQQFGGPQGSNGFQAFQPPQNAPMPTLGSIGQPQQAVPRGGISQQLAGYAAQQQQAGNPNYAPPMVMLSSPDGSVSKPVPAEIAPQFLAKGYRRVG